MADVVIIGAGLTGLSVAYHLEQAGFFDYTIFEKNERPGGLLRSETIDGFTFDYTGHLLHINDDYFSSFLRRITQFDVAFDFVTRKTGIFSHNVVTNYPFQMHLQGLPADVIIECIEGFIKRSKHIKQPQSFHAWVLKHFGPGLGKHFFFPYNSKLLAYDIKKIHPSWTGRFVPSTNLDHLLKGALGYVAPGIGYNSSFYYPFQGGIEFLIKKFSMHLEKKVSINACVQSIDPVKKIVYLEDGRKKSYRYLVSTMPLKELLKKIKTTQSNISSTAEKLLCTSVFNINIGFDVKPQNPMHWIYFPEKEYPFYRLGLWHNISAMSVPVGKSAAYIEIAQRSQNNTLLPKTIHMAEESIKKTTDFLGLAKHDVIARKDLFLPYAYVIYDAWRQHNLPKLLNCLKAKDMWSIGRYGAWKYASMQEAIIEGRDVAGRLCDVIKPACCKKEKQIYM